MIYAINKRTKEHRKCTPKDIERLVSGHVDISSDEFTVGGDSEGWIDWLDGDCPLPPNEEVQIATKVGIKNRGVAGDFRWRKQNRGGDIIAYRPIIDEPAKPNQWDGREPIRIGMKACTSGGECRIVAVDLARDKVGVQWYDGELGVVPVAAVKALPAERELAIDEMAKVIGEDFSRDIAQAMYDNGCRMYQHER